MSEDPTEQSVEFLGARRFLPLLGLFAGSGCAALIYEIVWFQMLQLVIGSSGVSLGVLLGTFMGGMCLGSLALPRLVSPRRHPLRMFACIEAGIGLCGVAALLLVPLIGRLYVAVAGHGLLGILLRGAVCGLCLLPPTMLMGATLPAISRWVETTRQGVSWLGFFYGGNIAGAAVGCLLAGFYLLRVHDVGVATYLAVAINGAVAATAFGLASVWEIQGPEAEIRNRSESRTPKRSLGVGETEPELGARLTARRFGAQLSEGTWPVYVAIALSGASALGAEVVWTRLLSLILGATVYTFSIILAVFLVGLGIGSGIGSAVGRWTARPRVALGVCQMLLVGAIALAAHLLAKSLPYWPINPSLSRSPWFNFQLDLLRCVWAVLPATCLWGASFPLALAAAARAGQDPGRLVGRVYAANTLGAIVGALGCSLVLMHWLGTQQVQRVLIGFCALAGLVMWVPGLCAAGGRSRRREGNGESSTSRTQGQKTGGLGVRATLFRGAFVAVALGWVWLLAESVPKVPWELVAYGRYLPTKTDWGTNLYVGEGMNASVAVTQISRGVRNFHVSGKVEASTDTHDMRLQRMLGHLPALLHPEPRAVLVVGCGAGVTAGSFTVHPGVERIVICEIEPLIPRVVARYFAAENYDVVHDPRVEVVYDDGRHFVLTTHEKFDIITSDPIHPWVKGAATLYTKEYFETVKRHLNPGGLVAQWVPLYESNPAAVKSELATFFDVFPNGTVWGNEVDGEGYDLVLLGQAGPLQIDPGQVQRRLNREDYQRVSKSLQDVGLRSAFSLLATYAGQASDLWPWLQRAELNRDRNLRLQYLAGMGLNLLQSDTIYTDMLSYRRFPEGLFVGTNEWVRALHLAIEPPKQEQESKHESHRSKTEDVGH
jgi:spermidine synthase